MFPRPETPKVKEVKVEEALVPQAKSERTLEETPRTPRPILKDHHASTTEPHEHVKFKVSTKAASCVWNTYLNRLLVIIFYW